MSITRTWHVYGADGHRQRESFSPSEVYDLNKCSFPRPIILAVNNADKTGTFAYSEVVITAPTAEACERELWGQLSDGLFENCRIGSVVEVIAGAECPREE